MDKDKIVREIASELNMSVRVVEQIVNSPFIFAKRVITSETDERPIRFPYFAMFALKTNAIKEQKYLMILRDVVFRIKNELKANEDRSNDAGLKRAFEIILDELDKHNIRDMVMGGLDKDGSF
jgi:hypothetical protein